MKRSIKREDLPPFGTPHLDAAWKSRQSTALPRTEIPLYHPLGLRCTGFFSSPLPVVASATGVQQ